MRSSTPQTHHFDLVPAQGMLRPFGSPDRHAGPLEAMDEFRRNFEVPVVMASTHFAQNPRKVNCSNSASIMKCLTSMQALRSFANKSTGAGYNPAFRLAPRKLWHCILGKLCSVVFLQVSHSL